MPWGWRGLVLVCLTVLGAWLFDFSFQKVAVWGSGIPRKSILSGLLVCLLAGAFLSVVIPVPSHIPSLHKLKLVATRESAAEFSGNEVRLASIQADSFDNDFDLRRICSGEWTYGDIAWVSSAHDPQQLACQFPAIDETTIGFYVGQSSGVVSVQVDQLPKEKEDLYASTSGVKKITLPVQAGRAQAAAGAVIAIAWGLWIGWFLFVIGLYLVGRPAQEIAVRPGPRWWFYSLVLTSVWLFYLSAFWPGILGPDAQDQWQQATTGQIGNWHPAFHTLNFWLISKSGILQRQQPCSKSSFWQFW